MRCPNCGNNTTIGHCSELEIRGGIGTHYCWSNPDPVGSMKGMIYYKGTEEGCCNFLMEGWEEQPPEVAKQPSVPDCWLNILENIEPLDPWGVPVDTRGYPSDWR